MGGPKGIKHVLECRTTTCSLLKIINVVRWTERGEQMKKCDTDLINFLKKYSGWQWYSNDRATRKVVNRLVRRNICIKNKFLMNTGSTHREVKLI